jgi:hypothetical protein
MSRAFLIRDAFRGLLTGNLAVPSERDRHVRPEPGGVETPFSVKGGMILQGKNQTLNHCNF